MTTVIDISVIIPTTAQTWGADMVRGICDEAELHASWRLHLWPDYPASATIFSQQWQQHGAQAAIVFPQPPLLGGPLRRLGVPTVAVAVPDGSVPVVRPDDPAIGNLAARHLSVPGWIPSAIGHTNDSWWLDRVRGFSRHLPDAVIHTIRPFHRADILAWLRALPPAAAVFVAHDALAALIAEMAPRGGRTLGADLRLLGVDDDLPCRMSIPALSSVRVPWRAIGRLAARTLAHGLAGNSMAQDQAIPPLGLAIRGSSDPLASAEPWLSQIGDRLRQAAQSGRDDRLDRLLDGCGRSRSAVERAWRATTGRSLLESLHLVRCEHAVALLAEGLSLAATARRVGCHDVTALRRLLRRRLGLAPGRITRLSSTHSELPDFKTVHRL